MPASHERNDGPKDDLGLTDEDLLDIVDLRLQDCQRRVVRRILVVEELLVATVLLGQRLQLRQSLRDDRSGCHAKFPFLGLDGAVVPGE